MKWISLLILALCGCASNVTVPPPHVSLADYTATKLPNDRYLISYKGTAPVATEHTVDLALLKASQVAQQDQLKYFVIIDQAASTRGEIKFRRTLPTAEEWNNELLIQGFKGRPRRTFCFLSAATEQAIYEKLRTAEPAEPL